MSDGTSRLARAASASPQLRRETNQAEAAGEADEEAADVAAAGLLCSASESSDAARSESMLGSTRPRYALSRQSRRTRW